jgi:hypothetical protein
MGDIRSVRGAGIDHGHVVPGPYQRVDHMRTDEPGSACDTYPHLMASLLWP